MHVEMIAGKHVQRGVVRQGKAQRLGVVGVLMHRRQLVGGGHFRLDAGDRIHSGYLYRPAGSLATAQGAIERRAPDEANI